jgi:hypothetical protein
MPCKWTLTFVAAAATSFLMAKSAFACSCAVRSPQEIMAQNDFVADILVTRVPPVTRGQPPMMEVQFLRIYKGLPMLGTGNPPRLKYKVAPQAACGVVPKAGDRYIVRGPKLPNFEMDLCSRMQSTEKTAFEYDKLMCSLSDVAQASAPLVKPIDPKPPVR